MHHLCIVMFGCSVTAYVVDLHVCMPCLFMYVVSNCPLRPGFRAVVDLGFLVCKACRVQGAAAGFRSAVNVD